MWEISNNCIICSTAVYSYDNKLDEDIQKLIRPFNIVLSAFLSSKFKIKDNFIFPCEKKYHILMFTILFCSNITSVALMFLRAGNDFDHIYSKVTAFCFVFYSINLLLLLTHNIVYSRSNITLLLIIQKINSGLDISNIFPSYIRRTWVFLFIIILNFFFCNYFFYRFLDSVSFVDVSSDLMIVAFDYNLVYGIGLMLLLVEYLKEWVERMRKLSYEDENNDYCHNMFELYKHILNAYNLHNSIFKLIVSVYSSFLTFILVKWFLVSKDLVVSFITKKQLLFSFVLGRFFVVLSTLLVEV